MAKSFCVFAKKRSNLRDDNQQLTHYRIRVLCRVPGAHGKVPQAHGKTYAVSCTRQNAHGTGPVGERLLCRVPSVGHTAKHDAVRLARHSAHKSDLTPRAA